MKGSNVFSKAQEAGIKKLLGNLENAETQNKKKFIRAALRKEYGFYISDFTSSKKGFRLVDFKTLIKNGRIKIV